MRAGSTCRSRDYLRRLKDAGLATLPGTAAEILDDEVRAVICPDKVNTEEWLEAHRTAHSVGLRSNVTIMFGTRRTARCTSPATSCGTRALQKETGGFTEFVPLPFVHMATPIFLQGKARRGPTFREVLLMHAVGRIAYRGWIDNIQASWVKCGVFGAQQILQAGANDLGGTLMDENISRAAGASHGQELDETELARHRRAARSAAGAAHHALRPYADRRQAASPSRGSCSTATAATRPSCCSGRAGERASTERSTSSRSATRWSTCSRTRPTTSSARTGVERGAMTMVDAARSDEIYAGLGPGPGDVGRLGREHRGRRRGVRRTVSVHRPDRR